MFDISIILPVYNVEPYLASCLDSLLAQSFRGQMQIILIEDKSPDESLSICRRYVSQYNNIELVEHKKNGGSAIARNSGLQRVQGKYFMFVDPDDLLPNNAMNILFTAIEVSGADIVKGSNSSFSANKVKSKASYSVDNNEEFFGEDCLTVLLEHEKLRGHPWGKIFRTSSFTDTRFTPGYRMAQDLLFCVEAFSKAKHVLLIPEIVYQYRIHSGGATGRKYETGAYLSWLKCISALRAFVSTEHQLSAYQELKIRTLTQLAREIKTLKGRDLIPVLQTVEETRKEWLPSFWQLVFKERISVPSMFRYLKYHRSIKQVKRLIIDD